MRLDEIRNILITPKNRIYRNWKEILTDDIRNFLHSIYKDSRSDEELLTRLKFNLINIPKCPICGKYRKLKLLGVYNDTCNEKYCIGKNRYNSTKESNLQNYGVENVYQLPEVIKRIRKINKEKSAEALQVRIKTCNERYGVDNCFQSEEKKELMRQTWQENYGECIINPGQAQEVKDKINDSWIKHYGGHPMKNKEYKQWYYNQVYNKYGVYNVSQLPEVIKKIFITQLINGSLGKQISKQETELYTKLKLIYPDTEQTYMYDKRYPFKCDIYIPNKDLFIEYQGSQYHHCHKFDPDSEEDIKELEKLIKRNEEKGGDSSYNEIIQVWTIKDPLKRQTAKDNNLNFIEVWPKYDYNKLLEQIISLPDYDYEIIDTIKCKNGKIKNVYKIIGLK